MKNVSCKNCGLVDDYRIVEKSGHHIAYCNGCGKYIKHIPHTEPKFYFGKYKYCLVTEVKDIEYLEWVWSNIRLSPTMRDAIDLQLQILYKTA